MPESIDELRALIADCNEAGTFDELRSVYARVPQTTCDRCGRCCVESPSIYSVEFAHICHAIVEGRVEERHPDLVNRVLHFWWAQLMLPDEVCPFLSESQCMVYDARPLNCRTFGLRTADGQRHAIENAQAQMRELADFWRYEGVELPGECLEPKLPTCDKPRGPCGERVKVNGFELDSRVLRIELSRVPKEDVLEGSTHGSFDAHLAEAILGRDKFMTRKAEAFKLFQSGLAPETVTRMALRDVRFKFSSL